MDTCSLCFVFVHVSVFFLICMVCGINWRVAKGTGTSVDFVSLVVAATLRRGPASLSPYLFLYRFTGTLITHSSLQLDRYARACLRPHTSRYIGP